MKVEVQLSGAAPGFLVRKGWKVVRLAEVARLRSLKNRPELPLLSVFLHRGVIPYGEGGGQVHKPGRDLAVYQVVCRGDLVLNNQQAWRGSVGVSRHEGIISPAYVVFGMDRRLESAYADYLFQSRDMIAQYVAASKGVGSIQRDVHMPWLKSIRVPTPPTEVQASIVRYLNWATGRIDRAIRAKKKVLLLLNEQKQAIIHRAVTRGLHPGISMKDSGLPWLGAIPKHWELAPNRAHLRIRKVLVGERHSDYRLLSLTKRGVIVRDLSQNKGKFSSDMGTSQEVRAGDLVFCLFDVPETPRTVGLSAHDGMITSAYTVMACRDPLVARWLEAFYIAMDDRKLLSPLYSGLRNTIPKDRFFGAKTPLPPADERQRILETITQHSRTVDDVVSREQATVDLLREYRVRLVADVVTGRLDVREAAESLPGDVTPNDGAAELEDDSDDLDEAVA